MTSALWKNYIRLSQEFMRRRLASISEKSDSEEAAEAATSAFTQPLTHRGHDEPNSSSDATADISWAPPAPSFRMTLEKQIQKLREKEDALNAELSRVSFSVLDVPFYHM